MLVLLLRLGTSKLRAGLRLWRYPERCGTWAAEAAEMWWLGREQRSLTNGN